MKKSVSTYCRVCEPACGLLADVDDQGSIRLSPDKAHPISKGFACNKGLSFTEINADPARLSVPQRRTNPRSKLPASFEPVGWDDAIQDIAKKLARIREQHGPESVAIYQGNPLGFNSTSSRSVGGFAAKIGARKFSAATVDCANKFVGSEQVFGTNNLHPLPDLEHTDYFLCIGENPKVSHMSFISIPDPMRVMGGIVARGGKVRYVNPRRIESVGPDTGELVQIKPDTDLYFLAAVLHEIDCSGGFKAEVLAKHARNIDGLRNFIAAYSPEAVADVVGLAAEDIRTVAREFSAAGAASVHMSTGVNMGRQGTLCYWLVHILSLVTGNLGRRGGNIYSPGIFATAQITGYAPGSNPWFEGPFGKMRKTAAGALPNNLMADYIAKGTPPIKALIVAAGNPLLSGGGEQRLRELLPGLELIVCIDLYRNATGEYADYLLPGVDWLEREDVAVLAVGMQSAPYAQYAPAIVPPAAERKQEWWMMGKLEQAMGLPSVLDEATPDLFKGINRLLAASDLSVDKLKQAPCGVVALPPPEPEWIFTLGVQTPDRKVDCCPAAFAEAIEQAASIFQELRREPAGQLKLITLRTNYMLNSWFQNLASLKRAKQSNNPLWISPEDAARLGLAEGSAITVSNANGAIEANVTISPTLRSGVVAMAHGWGNQATPGLPVAQAHPGVNVNRLLPTGPGSFEVLSSQSFMTGIPVEVQPRKAA